MSFIAVPRAVLVSVLAAVLALSHQRASQAQRLAPELQPRLDAVAKAIEEKRNELGIPGLSLVIVKDDKVIYQAGHGFKDLERRLPVTPDTLFAIGSCTKAFTATAVVMSADEGKLSLEHSPKKYLQYFKLQDPDADARVTVRDLLSHRTGLGNTDISWYTGVLSREEVIRAAGAAKPTAKLGEKFQYQNVMFSAAGEVAAAAEGSTWEQVIARRFFAPLGMKASNTSVKETLKSPDFAIGYKLEDKKATKVPMRDLTNIAPAGAINSNARDMAQWIRLMLAGGVYQGKRLVSEKGFSELTSKQIETGGGGMRGYGLGWGLLDWHGHKVLAHSGGIDGFNSIVALMPDQNLGFVMLTNVSTSPILGTAMEAVWSNLVGKPEPAAKVVNPAAIPASAAADPKTEVGSYAMPGFSVEVVFKNDRLVAITEGQPEYPLTNVGGRRYKLEAPAPDGFFMTFRPVKDQGSDTEMFLEQPHGNAVLTKKKPSASGSAGGDHAPTSMIASPGMAVDELMARMIAAAGGEANWRSAYLDGRHVNQ
jgi:CubicO group peptidase (beta-lactamase class C family)